MFKKKLRSFLWHCLGFDYNHIQKSVDFVFLTKDKFTTFGKGTYNNHAKVYRWSNAPIIIGKYCSISYDVKFIVDDGSHKYNIISNYPFQSNEVGVKKGITVGNDVWIGMNAIILPGVNIGNGATIAAGAVITRDVPDYTVVAGIPARIIMRKCSEQESKIMNKIAWWNWDEEKIKNRVGDFKLSFYDFIQKYK